MKRIFSRLFMVMFIALALSACTNSDSEFIGVGANGQSESTGEGEDLTELTAVLVLAPYQDPESASEVEDWGLRLAEATGHAVKVGFTDLPAVTAEAANLVAAAEADDFQGAAAAADAVKALKPTRVICFKLVAFDDGDAATDDIATRMEGEVAAALETFGEGVTVARVNGFGYGDFMVAYLGARLNEINSTATTGALNFIINGNRTVVAAKSALIVPVAEYPGEEMADAMAVRLKEALGVKEVLIVKNTAGDIIKACWYMRLRTDGRNIKLDGHNIVIPYLATSADLLVDADLFRVIDVNDDDNWRSWFRVVFNCAIIDGDASFTVLDAAIDNAE